MTDAPETALSAGNICSRMVAVMRELGAIGKDKKNESQGFKYRGIDDVYNAINPILSKHGVFMIAEILGKTREERTNAKGTVLAFTCLHMRYQFVSEDGSSIKTEAEGEGMDSGDKSSNKAMAVAHKYALLQAFCIPTQDLVDPDAETHEVKAAPKPTEATQTAETLDGVQNWIAKQKGVIDAAVALPALFVWLDDVGAITSPCSNITTPESGSPLDRLKRKVPEAFKEIVAYYQARVEAISKQSV